MYFAFDSFSLQDLAPAKTSDTSATASTNDDKQAVIFSDAGVPSITSSKAKVKRKEVASVAAVENCLEIMQYLWMQFYDNNFVCAYFAKLRALRDPRIWIIGGDGPVEGARAHYFDMIVEHFMPQRPSDRIDDAVRKVLSDLAPKRDDDKKDVEA